MRRPGHVSHDVILILSSWTLFMMTKWEHWTNKLVQFGFSQRTNACYSPISAKFQKSKDRTPWARVQFPWYYFSKKIGCPKLTKVRRGAGVIQLQCYWWLHMPHHTTVKLMLHTALLMVLLVWQTKTTLPQYIACLITNSWSIYAASALLMGLQFWWSSLDPK